MAEAETTCVDNAKILTLPEEFTIASMGEYYPLLKGMVDNGGDLELDGAGVGRIDAAGVQLLCVIQRTLLQAGRSVRWHDASDALRDSVALLGLSEQVALAD